MEDGLIFGIQQMNTRLPDQIQLWKSIPGVLERYIGGLIQGAHPYEIRTCFGISLLVLEAGSTCLFTE